jgi:hypothetical protein
LATVRPGRPASCNTRARLRFEKRSTASSTASSASRAPPASPGRLAAIVRATAGEQRERGHRLVEPLDDPD